MGKPSETYLQLKHELEESREELIALKNELSRINHMLENQNKTLDETYTKLVVSEENFRQLAENTNEIIWLRNEAEFIYINNQFERIWGRSKDEIMRDPGKLADWIHPEDRENVNLWFNISDLVDGQPRIEQYRVIKPDKDILWLWTRSFPVRDENGSFYRIVSITTDITEQKNFEDTLKIAKEKAQESDLLKSTFLANISHEIRTPMNGIIGFAELIARGDIDRETRKSYLEIMKKSSDQLICIINDIIDFSKIESNQIRISEEQLELNNLLDQLNLFYENELRNKRLTEVTLVVEKASKEPLIILTDENRLRQVLSYLLDNSVKYTNQGFIKFGYRMSGSKLDFFVEDSGKGIPTEKQKLIFERFRQADEGHSRKYGGVGLGLPISKGLVNLLGGSIWVESEPGKGSVFCFTIPYKTTEGLHLDRKSGFEENIEILWKNKLILVAEDDDFNFEYLKALLEPIEVRIIRAQDGNQAVKLCSKYNFDLILMDIRLPVLNGIQATERIRKMGRNIPIIAQTAFAMDKDAQKCFEAGCNKFIAKPISKESLYRAMKELVQP
jgi:PAS domain S-box-containing protein